MNTPFLPIVPRKLFGHLCNVDCTFTPKILAAFVYLLVSSSMIQVKKVMTRQAGIKNRVPKLQTTMGL